MQPVLDSAAAAWADLQLSNAEVVSLRLRGARADGSTVEIRYELGSVMVATTDTKAQQVLSRALNQEEAADLLAYLREQSRMAPLAQRIGSGALHCFVSSLAASLNSAGPIPFATAAFGAVVQKGDGELEGSLVLDAQTLASISDRSGELRYEVHARGKPRGVWRPLSARQLRSLIAALRTFTASAGSAGSSWTQILADAIARNESLLAAGLGASKLPA